MAATATEEIYEALLSEGIDVLLDDRHENPGVKFNDADLIGLPVRVTIGERSLKNGNVELKVRSQDERRDVPVDKVVEVIKEELENQWRMLRASIVEVKYPD